MFWIILFAMLGLTLGILAVIFNKDKDIDGVLPVFTCMAGAIAESILATIGTGVIGATVPESEYETLEVDRQAFAISETGDLLYFDSQLLGTKAPSLQRKLRFALTCRSFGSQDDYASAATDRL